MERSSYRYEPRPDRNAELRSELVKLARQKPRYGYRRLHAFAEPQRPRGEREASLPAVRGRGPDGAAQEAQAAGAGTVRQNSGLTGPNQEWAMDFIVDGLATGRMVRILSVVGRVHARVPGTGGPTPAWAAARVTRVLERLIAERGPTRERALGQRPGVHLATHDRLGGGLQGRSGAHPAGPTDAERPRRELPRPPARRVPEHKLVPDAETMSGVLWQPGARSTTASAPTARWTTAHPTSSAHSSKGEGPWPLSLRKTLTINPTEDSSYEWMRKKGAGQLSQKAIY